ncbi:hypothetical protein SAMN06297387_12914 [Streptomyces zhaozhouensis]|uniref:Proteins of 100 residues with WXG n=1 Tax=Streptomyces zhaozhouensis TaxID=1300267 RepID=A0A286E8C3_9ACTN|nr:hypothetical protein [Streptomyces zhaozhouensis]SOD67168.1 hypothetical protein SAMN06297387_12914 [Streptomyces zhaozhouensis]
MSLSFPVTPAPAQAADYPALGFVPCPGDPPTAGRVAHQVRQTATALGDVVALLRGTGGGQWRGRAAEAWREQFDDDFKPKVEAAHESFVMASRALEDWATHMPPAQREAERLEHDAQALRSRLDRLPGPTALSELLALEEGDERDSALEENARAQRDRDRVEQDLEDVRRRARDLAVEYTQYGEEIADRLDRAMDIAPNEPGWLSSIGDWVGGLVEGIAAIADNVLQAVGRWIAENATAFRLLGDICGLMSAALGIAAVALGALAVIPMLQPLAGPAVQLGIASGGFAIAATAAHGAAKLGGEEISARTFAQDLLGIAPFGSAFRAGSLLGTIGRSWATEATSGFGLIDSITSLIQNASTDQAGPAPEESATVDAVTLMEGFDSAWQEPSAAHEGHVTT